MGCPPHHNNSLSQGLPPLHAKIKTNKTGINASLVCVKLNNHFECCVVAEFESWTDGKCEAIVESLVRLLLASPITP